MRRDSTPIVVQTAAGLAQSLAPIDYSSSAYDEDWLQQLLFEHPDCLPISELEPGFGRIVPICRELPTSQGPLDNLFMTGHGDLILVEAKLWRNGEARREVVAQALDYASDVLQWSFEELDQRVREARKQQKAPDARLYDLFDDADVLDEPQFVDAVNANLILGRVLILIVGDGIRPQAEKLVGLLQAHAGLHFRLALVELSMFKMPGSDDILVAPRTLLQTKTIERGVVRIDQSGRLRVEAPAAKEVAPAVASSITAEQFFEAMRARDARIPDALQQLIADLQPLGVYPEFKKTLLLKWDPPEGKPVNLGYIQRDGRVRTEAVNWFGREALGHPYIEELASEWGLDIDRETFDDAWHLRAGKHFPLIENLLPLLPRWKAPIAHLINAFQALPRAQSRAEDNGKPEINWDKFTVKHGDLLIFATPFGENDWRRLETETAVKIKDDDERAAFLDSVKRRDEKQAVTVLARNNLGYHPSAATE